MKIFVFFLVLFAFGMLFSSGANGMLVGDGKKESDVILVGKVVSFQEQPSLLETDYTVQVEEYLKYPDGFAQNTTVTITAPGLRDYPDPSRYVMDDKIYEVGDRVLFLLKLNGGNLEESLYSLTTKSSCTPKQLLEEMYGPSGFEVSQNNQTKHFYTNQPLDLTYYGYNRDLVEEKKNFEFQVNIPETGEVLSEKRELDFQECKRTTSVSWSFTPTIEGKYTIHSILGNHEGGSESISGLLIIDKVAPPLKQWQQGLRWLDAKCNKDLELVLKVSNGHFACVNQDSVESLVKRGWGSTNRTSDMVNPQTYLVDKEANSFQVQYSLSGATLSQMLYDEDSNSLRIKLNDSEGGKFVVSLPRELIDAKIGKSNTDDVFFILIDGIEFAYGEKTNPTERTLTIYFPKNSHEIEIIGTSWI